MPNLDILTDNNILRMKMEEAADFCGYNSIQKFRFDFKVRFGKGYKQKRIELKQDFIRQNYKTMSTVEIAKALHVTQQSITQMRTIMGLTSYQHEKRPRTVVVELTDKVILGENNLKISARILAKPIPKQHRIKIKQIDSKHAVFEIMRGRKKYIEGEYFHPYHIFDAKEQIEQFIGRIAK